MLLIAFAACGDNTAGPSTTPDAFTGCSATFSGNFAETSTADQCATMTDAKLELMIPTTTLAAAVKVDIDLGSSVSVGSYSSDSVASWTARGVVYVGDLVCVYSAGATAVPTGDFALHVASVDAVSASVHGSLMMTIYVLAFPGTDCGDGDTERVDLRF
jgi:hypothetical protein